MSCDAVPVKHICQVTSHWLLSCVAVFADSSRKDEIKSLTANDFNEFYGRVKGIKDFHRKHPNEVVQISLENN